jgi:hypothetical protein
MLICVVGESSITEAQAEAACASIEDPSDRKDCVYDIFGHPRHWYGWSVLGCWRLIIDCYSNGRETKKKKEKKRLCLLEHSIYIFIHVDLRCW